MMMKPSARRRGALALLALAGCGVAQNMGQWVGGEHCAGSHCGPSKEEKRLAREEARRRGLPYLGPREARAEAESEHLAAVAREPAAFVLHLSGHHDRPASNGKYTYGGVANGRPQWVKAQAKAAKRGAKAAGAAAKRQARQAAKQARREAKLARKALKAQGKCRRKEDKRRRRRRCKSSSSGSSSSSGYSSDTSGSSDSDE